MGLGGESAGLGGSRGSALGEMGRKWAILVQIPPWVGRILKEAGKRQRLQRFIDYFFFATKQSENDSGDGAEREKQLLCQLR